MSLIFPFQILYMPLLTFPTLIINTKIVKDRQKRIELDLEFIHTKIGIIIQIMSSESMHFFSDGKI